jgi:hypothetical protein
MELFLIDIFGKPHGIILFQDFFANPKTDRAKLFLSQILDH